VAPLGHSRCTADGNCGLGNGRPAAAPANRSKKAHFTRVTDFESVEAAISPDGRFVAFVSDHDGPFDVWLTQVGTGRVINLNPRKKKRRPVTWALTKRRFFGRTARKFGSAVVMWGCGCG